MTASKIAAIFKRLDTDEDGTVSYSDFVDLILPLDPMYEGLLRGRVAKNHHNAYTFLELFTFRTRDSIKALFQLTADLESQLSTLRSGLISFRERLFSEIDVRETGRVDSGQLLRYCERNGLPLTSAEAELLHRRLDKNADGLITYADFLREFQP